MQKKITANLFVAFGLLVLAGCIKDDSFFSTDTSEFSRKQIVKIAGGGEDVQIISRDENPVNDEFQLIELTREPNNEGELNQPLTVKLALDPALIPEGYEALPADAYEIVGGTDVTFQAGEVVKSVMMKLNKSKLDLTKRYAIGFNIADAGGAVASKDFGQAIYEVGVKNAYHADYVVNINLTHPTASGNYPDEVQFATAGPTTVVAPLGIANIFAPTSVVYITVNADNKLSITSNAVVISLLGNNYYDPATKTFHFDYGWSDGTRRIQGTAVRQ
jgi:hypothetical protein